MSTQNRSSVIPQGDGERHRVFCLRELVVVGVFSNIPGERVLVREHPYPEVARFSPADGAAAEAVLAVKCVVVLDHAEFRATEQRAPARCVADPATDRRAANRRQVGALVGIVGDPFDPVAADPAWRPSDVLALARHVYVAGAFDVLPVLADALEDAGCGDDRVLGHCRGGGRHVPGCWVLVPVLAEEVAGVGSIFPRTHPGLVLRPRPAAPPGAPAVAWSGI